MWLFLVLILGFSLSGALNDDKIITVNSKPENKKSQCPPNWFYSLELQQCYYISNNFSTFADAKNYCSQNQEGELVSIYNQYEYNVVSAYIEQQSYEDTFPSWIGLQTYAFEPHYRWQDKNLANYTHFVNGTTPANTTDQSCFAWLKTVANDGWIVVDCQNPLPFICKRHVAYGNDVFVNGTSGTITSPKYPIPYEPSVTSYYYISVPLGNVIDLTFNFLAIDSDSLIRVYDGWTDNSTVLETITNTYRSNMIESTSNQMMVEFVASGSSGGRYFGWSASYNAIVPITFSGELVSSNYPLNADNNEKLQVDIRVPTFFGIIFYIWDFESHGYADLKITSEYSNGVSQFLYWTSSIATNEFDRLNNSNARITWNTHSVGNLKALNLTWVVDP